MNLEEYYSGEEHWQDIVDHANDEFWSDFDYKVELMSKLEGNDDIAKVVFAKMGLKSIDWLDRRIPALGNLKPIDCLKSDNLRNRLKECLLRMY